MSHAQEHRATIVFGRFQVLPHLRELLADGRPVRLGGRAYDVLLALIDARGAVVGRGELLARVWPDRVVEDNALQVQISALRAALGPDRSLIRTVSGRGYQFTSEIRVLAANPEERAGGAVTMAPPSAVMPPTNLPEKVSELIGRDDALQEILGLVAEHRLVTLTGPGGIGKTRLALEAARSLLPEFGDGIWVVELAPITDPALVPAAIAAAAGLEFAAGAVSPENVANELSGKRILLVLDNCEHVIDDAATMAEALTRAIPSSRVIATSREPLKAEGEWVCPVPPLGIPAEHAKEGDDPMRYGAVRLFLDRARAGNPHFAPDTRQARMMVDICRRLDGIPLALELAAARVAALGIEELAARLDDRFQLLTGGRRTALARQRTLRATLDWSFELLPGSERAILRRLSIFAGWFTLAAAGAVLTSADLPMPAVVEGIANLVAKSLVSMGAENIAVRYRLLETTRIYARERLGESGERARLARRHAEYFRDLFARAESQLKTRPAVEWRADYSRQIDDLRVALDWAFSTTGDAPVGIALTAAAVPLWMQLSLMAECGDRVGQALTALTSGAQPDARIDMILNAAHGASLTYSRGPRPETVAAWSKTLRHAEDLDDTEYRLRALRGLWSYRMNSGEYPDALVLADEFRNLAERQADWATVRAGNRMAALILHYLGEQAEARKRIEAITRMSVAASPAPPTARLMVDPDVAAPALLARILWLQGFPDQATRTAEVAVQRAKAADHTISMCHALAQAACPVALWTGDLPAAEGFVATLTDLASRHSLGGWIARAQCFEGALLISQGQTTRGAAIIQAAVPKMGAAGSVAESPAFLAALAHGRGLARQKESGLTRIDEAIERSENTGERWCAAELLRVKGELLLSPGAPDRSAAADHFRRALDVARRQGALSWELRAATSLASLLRDQDKSTDAEAILRAAYKQFTEGFDTADLKSARLVLEAAGTPSERDGCQAGAN